MKKGFKISTSIKKYCYQEDLLIHSGTFMHIYKCSKAEHTRTHAHTHSLDKYCLSIKNALLHQIQKH